MNNGVKVVTGNSTQLQSALHFYNEIGRTQDAPATEDPESMRYLLLIKVIDDDNGDEYRAFEVIEGRKSTYDYIRELIRAENINPLECFVMSNKTTLDEAVSFYQFMKYMVNSEKIVDDTGFDIEEYVVDPEVEHTPIAE